MEWGPHLETLYKSQESGSPTPALDNRPEVFEDLRYIFEGFWDLNKTRLRYPAANGVHYQPIQFVEIAAYCDIVGIEDRDTFTHYVQILDKEFFEWTSRH